MKQHSEDEQALVKIQYEWADARMKGDSSYTRHLEAENCTIVWPDGSIVNKRDDLKSMTGDTGIVVGQGTIRAHEGKQNLLDGKFVWTDIFIKQHGEWKTVASQMTPVLKK
jgi:hypothetical protein